MTEEEFFEKDKDLQIAYSRYSDPLYECPKCGNNTVCRDLESCMCLASNPPQYTYSYKCLNEHCDYEVRR